MGLWKNGTSGSDSPGQDRAPEQEDTRQQNVNADQLHLCALEVGKLLARPD
jgi:hypothetical protein